jgi:hypothetical protein
MYTARWTLLAGKVLSNFGQPARIRPRPAGEAASSNSRHWNWTRPGPLSSASSPRQDGHRIHCRPSQHPRQYFYGHVFSHMTNLK